MTKSRKATLAILSLSLANLAWCSDPPAAQPVEIGTADAAAQVALLKAQLAEQKKQIEQLTASLTEQQKLLDRLAQTVPVAAPAGRMASVGNVASLASTIVATSAPADALPMVLPASPQAAVAAQAGGPSLADLGARLSGYLRNVVRISGDMRFRYDLQDRSSNEVAGPLQNSRERYRFRLNFDKDLFLSDTSATPWVKFHAQLSTAPFNNPLTNDTDFSGIDTKAPISVAEAWMDVAPFKGFTLRAGRTSELFADNRQFIWDDDVRFNGFHETYRYTAKNSAFVEVKAAQYILTNPNTPIVPAGSPYLTAGYTLGTRVPSSAMFDEGIVVGGNLNKKWSMNGLFNYNVVREPNQIQLASTAAGFPLLTSPTLGATLTGPLPQTGNATTTNGGAIYFADGFNVLHGALNLNYSGTTINKHNFPFQLFLQATHNTKASFDENGYALGASFGQVARLGDVQFQYEYLYKPANAFISQFTDDDVGTATGVNIKVQHIRLNFGITRFLVWENRVFFQKGISRSNPAINYFVPLPQGYNLLTRFQSQFLFTF
jgi:uncharacterized coiled-coil protein SlyX